LAVGFLVLSLYPPARRAVPWSAWGRIAVLGLLWMALPMSMFPYAERSVSSAMTGMLNGAGPVFIAIAAAVMARRWPSRGILAGLLLGVAGTVIMAWRGMAADSSSAWGVALVLFAMACYGVSVNLARPLQQEYGGAPVIWRALLIASLLTAPLGAPELVEARWQTWPLIALACLGVFGTGVAYIVYITSAGRFGAVRAGATAFLIPVVALALGVGVRGETVAPLALAGGVVCLTGAWLMKRASEFR
jgi:drug/metabolite transporter (DMT)-like permease